MKQLPLIATLSFCALLAAASREVEDIDTKTAEALRAADSAFPTAIEDLNKKYLENLRKLEADRQKAGDLKQLLLVRDDIKLFEEKLEINNGASFPGLQFWREAYAQKYHQLKREQLEKKLALLEGHRAALDAIRKKMTQANLIEEALSADQALQDFAPRIAQAREELKAWIAKTPAEAVGLTAKTPAAPAPGDNPGKATVPSENDPFPSENGTPKPSAPASPLATTPNTQKLPAGKLLAWGRPDFGQNEFPASIREASLVASGWYHSLGLTPDGRVITWGGRGWNGSERKIEPLPSSVMRVPDNLPPAVGIAAGHLFSAARFADGSIRVWGEGPATEIPKGVRDVVDLKGGKGYLIAQRGDGRVFVWGPEVEKYKLQVPEDLEKVSKISAGAFHIAVLTTDGRIRAWGDNTFGQCNSPGYFSFEQKEKGQDWTSSKEDSIVSVAAGSEATYALGKSGKIYGWGGKEYNQQQIPSGNDFIHIEAGDRFAVGVSKVGRLRVWGTKEYSLTPDGKAQDVVKVAALNDQILAISADDNTGQPFSEKWKKWNPAR